jgi:tetratricopeptide (TPR) repeat protein
MYRKFLRAVVLITLAAFIFSCGEKKQDQKTVTPQNLSPADALTEQIKKEPNNPDLYFKRAKWNLSTKKITGAENDILKAINLDSSRADYFLLKADICFAGFHIVDAENAFNKSISLDPKNVDAYLKLAELNLYTKKYEESIKNVNEALRIDKHLSKAYFIKGFVYKETKDTLRAISSFLTCIEQDHNYYDAIIQVANLYAVHNDPIALQYYNNALKLQPHSVEALYDRGLFYQNTGEIEKAVNDYNELLKVDASYGYAYFNLGFIAMKYENDFAKAIPLFTSAIRYESHYVEAYFNRGVCYEKIGDKQKAKADYNEALSIYPSYDLAKKALKGLR